MQLILQDQVEVPVSILSLLRHLYLSFSTPTFLKCENPKITIRNNLPLETVTDSCRMDEMYEIVHQATYRCFGNDEVYKLVMDDMYEIG